MGTEIDRTEFTEEDFACFRARLPEQLAALDRVLARPGFGVAPRTIGAELELFLVDAEGQPRPIGSEVIERVNSPRVSPELARFEIELCSQPIALAGRPFAALARDLAEQRALIDREAGALAARTVAVSILPTLRRGHLTARSITNSPRYHALTAGMRALRQSPFQVRVDGDDPLEVMSDDAAMEGANTAFQIHLLAAPAEFAGLFNAALAASGPALAAAGNSPTFLGHRLWEETRVAVFKQAGDVRPPGVGDDWRPPARINFGTGWMRDGAAEQFRESVALHEPLLPVCSPDGDRALAVAEAGGTPPLAELRLHHGTVWYWNRAVYDPAGAGNLRIELRALPAGPTLPDMLANAAFILGLTLDLAPQMSELLPGFPFTCAERNFYRAAQQGLAAELLWPVDPGEPPRPLLARALLPTLIERAHRGLHSAGVAAEEIDTHLGTFSARVDKGVTGAQWQRRCLAELEQQRRSPDRARAISEMLQRYMSHAATGHPVHTWPS
jgi:gamma-glutamyl:cysteine ligase YbdK (ATP-grasp superfamily)